MRAIGARSMEGKFSQPTPWPGRRFQVPQYQSLFDRSPSITSFGPGCMLCIRIFLPTARTTIVQLGRCGGAGYRDGVGRYDYRRWDAGRCGAWCGGAGAAPATGAARAWVCWELWRRQYNCSCRISIIGRYCGLMCVFFVCLLVVTVITGYCARYCARSANRRIYPCYCRGLGSNGQPRQRLAALPTR